MLSLLKIIAVFRHAAYPSPLPPHTSLHTRHPHTRHLPPKTKSKHIHSPKSLFVLFTNPDTPNIHHAGGHYTEMRGVGRYLGHVASFTGTWPLQDEDRSTCSLLSQIPHHPHLSTLFSSPSLLTIVTVPPTLPSSHHPLAILEHSACHGSFIFCGPRRLLLLYRIDR